ncbi:hypothetical protein LTR85_001551 [Meristemomyces frigidus]|nr:hypothetical protein LTR85_001551 [Meristemomyces frigidus]
MMAGPFSITVGAVGISTAAITSILQLKEFISGLVDAPSELKKIRADLEAIEPSLSALKVISTPDEQTLGAAKAEVEKTGLAKAVNSCGDACERFNARLGKWTRHSSREKMDWTDRLKIGVWEKSAIQKMAVQVETCKTTLSLAVTSTNLLVLNRLSQSGVESDSKKAELQAQMKSLEDEIQENIKLSKQLEADREERREKAEQALDEADDEEESKINSALSELRAESDVLEDFQVNCGTIFSQVQSGRTGLVIGDVKTDESGLAIVGLPESVIGRINARIGNATTAKNASAFVGVYDKNVGSGGFFRPPQPGRMKG